MWRALVGSEGTWVTVLEATVRLVDSPPVRSLLVLGYPDVYTAGDHIMEVLAHRPIGLEGIDSPVRQRKQEHMQMQRSSKSELRRAHSGKRRTRREIVVITGASAGVGRATVRAFARRGAYSGLVARGRDGLEGARQDVEALGARPWYCPRMWQMRTRLRRLPQR